MSSERSWRYEAWNEVCDADALWGPLVALRPAPEQAFTRLRLLGIVSLFGVFYGTCGAFILAWVHRLTGWPVPPPAIWPLGLTATAFVCGEITFLRAWNERARRLVRREAWLVSQGKAESATER